MTKDELKEQYSAPKKEDFATLQDYLDAKGAWIADFPDEYEEIINAPA
jgi:hypothetical protein